MHAITTVLHYIDARDAVNELDRRESSIPESVDNGTAIRVSLTLGQIRVIRASLQFSMDAAASRPLAQMLGDGAEKGA